MQLRILHLFLISLFFVSTVFAEDIYVDADCGDGITIYNAVGDSCTGGSDRSYSTVVGAVAYMSGGDDIYIRGGTYTEYATLSPSDNGTSENWTTIQSYPGEWAVIDADAAEHYCLGHNNYDKVRGASMLEYWKFERLELMGGDDSGLFITGGPFVVRYCYIHDNLAPEIGANPCGIKGMIWKDSVVEYCYFKNNGHTQGGGSHAVTGMQIHSDFIYNDPDVGPADIDNAYQNNTYKYNFFEDTEDRATVAIHTKALQTLTPMNTIDWTYEEYGNKIHHNITRGLDSGIKSQQCFAQIYNNIILECSKDGIVNADSGNGRAANAQAVYNNTLYQSRIGANFGSSNFPGWKNPYVYWYNNIVDYAPVDASWRLDIFLGTEAMENPYTYDSSRTDINNNYNYRPRDANQIKVARSPGVMSMATYDSTYTTTNYVKASSEGADNLYVGASGSDQYITRGAHVVEGAIIISDGGIGGSHPYLSGVTIPSYIGATNPDDNDWVDGVLSLDVAYFTSVEGESDPTWVEGAEAASTPSMSGVSFSGGGNGGG